MKIRPLSYPLPLAAPGKILDDNTDPSGHKGKQADPEERPHGALPLLAATEHLLG